MDPIHLRLPRLSYDDLQGTAEKFLSHHNPGNGIPVPIEEIVELSLKMDIVPVPGLRDLLSQNSDQPEACCTRDYSAIHVDERIYLKHPKRYRFSLAHEVSHSILHREAFPDVDIQTVQDYRDLIMSIDAFDYRWLEKQANDLAGLLLVPPSSLRQQIEEITQRCREGNLAPIVLPAQFLNETLSDTFHVNPKVVEIRLKKDSLYSPHGLKVSD